MKKLNLSFIFSALFLFTLTSCYQLFQGKIPMKSDKPNTPLSTVMEEKLVITQLPAPGQVFVSQGLSKDTIEISWSEVEGAAFYRLERAIKKAEDDTLPEETEYAVIKASGTSNITSSYVAGTKYTDQILSNAVFDSEEYGNIYYYRVSAENPQADYDASEFTVSEKAFLFAPPASVSATAGESTEEVVITWDSVPKATWYNVYRSADSTNANPVKLQTVSGNVFSYKNKIGTSEQGIDFYYTVEAVNSNSNASVKSAIAMGYALKDGAPARVSGVKITENKGRGDGPASSGIEVTWASAGEGLTYTVYRSSNKDSSLTQIATGITATSILDKKSLKQNTYYYYRILASKIIGEEEVKGPMSKSGPADAEPAEGFIISAPADISVNKIGNRCEIKFSQPIGEKGFLEDSKLSGKYKSYKYKILGGDTLSEINNTVSYSEVYPVDGYYTVMADQAYKFYQIITTNEDGSVESAASNVVAPSPSAATNISATKHAWIDGAMTVSNNTASHVTTVTGANANGIFPVKITWASPKDGADGGYHIYRSTLPDTAYRRITDEPVKGLEYIDFNDTAKAGTFYYYKVLSLNTLGNGTNFSDYDMGYGALTYDQYLREYNKTIIRSQAKLTYRNKPGTTDKLGTETINGDLKGTLLYEAKISGLGARIIMLYTDYVDYNVSYDNKGTVVTMPYFHLDGNTNTKAEMDSSGTMDGTVICNADCMYPGSILYDDVKIVGGNAGGGYYTITPPGFPAGYVDYRIGLEGW